MILGEYSLIFHSCHLEIELMTFVFELDPVIITVRLHPKNRFLRQGIQRLKDGRTYTYTLHRDGRYYLSPKRSSGNTLNK